MFLADVLGTVVSPVQHPVLDAQRLLLVRPLSPPGEPAGIARQPVSVHQDISFGDTEFCLGARFERERPRERRSCPCKILQLEISATEQQPAIDIVRLRS